MSLRANSVRKIMKDHGNAYRENLRGQMPVCMDDIVTGNDSFYYSGITKEGKPSITFEKIIGNKYVVVEYISDKHHNLEVQTMWINKKRT